ncbi:MAG: protein kinase, partial [Candidatus Eremiobacterota bacterium]
LKPGNIYLKEKGKSPIIGDFGICFFTEKEERLTAIKEVVGPRFFIAPELEDGRLGKITPKSDIYSLGKILYWLISNGEIFAREKHHEPEYDLTKKLPSSAPYLINTLLDKMIVENPDKRCKDVGKVIEELDILIRRIQMNAHVIDLKVPQHCNYCGVGKYDVKVDVLFNPNKRDDAVEYFGFNSRNGNWLIFVCDYCANVQIFRPDYSNNENAWREPKK